MFEAFSLNNSMKNKRPLVRYHFWPHDYNLNNIGRGLQDKATHQASIKGLGLLISDKKNFKVLPIDVYVEKFDISVKIVKISQRLYLFWNFIGPISLLLHTKPQGLSQSAFYVNLYRAVIGPSG